MASYYEATNITDTLSTPPNEAARIQIWEALFGPTRNSGQPLTALEHKELFSGYFQNLYKDELEHLMRGLRKDKTWKLGRLTVQSHQEVLDVVKILESRKKDRRSQILLELKSKYNTTDESQIEKSVDLAVRIRFMVNAGDPSDYDQTLSEPLKWKDDQTLVNYLRSSFPRATWKPEGKDRRLNPLFTAAYMVEVCGLELEETPYLDDHLKLYASKNKNILRYFPYKSCLHALQTAAADPILPGKVLQETIKSLNLLFPMNDAATGILLRRRGQHFHRDQPLARGRTLNVLEFDIWRDRLLELHQEVFMSPPASWVQLYKDRRDPQRFYTFWIALVILMLTIVSTFASILQAVYSVLAYHR